MPQKQPYLSIVATARNDDHGGNLLRRVQTFVNAVIRQSQRHNVRVELVLVEWNPPLDRQSLSDALTWPADSAPCTARVITVPAACHRKYRFGALLPLYQMIGKNVGIRRARGEFVLATNIDILLSDELMAFVAARRLEPDRMYRIDRHDVEAEVPVDAPVAEQLAYCATHLIRVNAREGTFNVNREGDRMAGAVDVLSSDTGISFGRGWYAPEQHFGSVFRWVADEAEILVRPSNLRRTLVIDGRPGPAANFARLDLEAQDGSGRALGRIEIGQRSLIRIQTPPETSRLTLRVKSSVQRSLADARTLCLCVYSCGWQDSRDGEPRVTALPAPSRWFSRTWQIAREGARFLLQGRGTQERRRIGLPIPAAFLRGLQPRAGAGGISVAIGGEGGGPMEQAVPAELHTNACGDFTLLHRDRWHELRGYPEFDLYSMNLDSLFCYMAHYGGARELVLEDPMRVYHIEHASGSGWTPEGEKLLFGRLKERGIPWLPYEDVLSCAAMMERLHTTMLFNGNEWGLAEEDLAESRPYTAGFGPSGL